MKATLSTLEPLVGAETHCSNDKSLTIEYSTDKFLSGLKHRSFQHAFGNLKSPQKTEEVFEIVQSKDLSSKRCDSGDPGDDKICQTLLNAAQHVSESIRVQYQLCHIEGRQLN